MFYEIDNDQTGIDELAVMLITKLMRFDLFSLVITNTPIFQIP